MFAKDEYKLVQNSTAKIFEDGVMDTDASKHMTLTNVFEQHQRDPRSGPGQIQGPQPRIC